MRATLAETITILNEWLPRPALGGVTPQDVHEGRKEEKGKEIKRYRQQEESEPVGSWERSYWEVLKSGVGLSEMSDGEVLTKLSFFGRRPLRRMAKRNRESVG